MDSLAAFETALSAVPEGNTKAGAVPRLLHVTDALPFTGDRNSPAMLAAIARGLAVHKATEDFDRGLAYSIDPEWSGYLNAWQNFIADSAASVIEIELRLEDEPLQCVGTIDRVAKIGKHVWILDIKTGGPWPTHGCQTACYEAMFRRHANVAPGKKIRRACVHVRQDGGYTLHEHTSPHDLNVWMAYARIARFEIENGLREAPKYR